MDWRFVNFDWNRARAFLITAEEGSLSAAARALGVAQPTLGRQVKALEEELGVALFERVGKGLELTPGGLELVEYARAMADAAGQISLAASGQSLSIEGTVRITATEVTSAFILPPIIAKLRRLEPGIMIDLVATNSMRDLRRREADIAIRSARPSDPQLIARKLRDTEARLFASAGYLDKMCGFHSPEDLKRAHFIGFEDNAPLLDGLNAKGLGLSESNFPLLVGNHLAQWEMVKNGLGLGVMLTRIGEAEPLVRCAAPWFDPFPIEVWLAAHRELRTSRRIRLVFDFLAAEIEAIE